ncbi:uncharacterized protein LOC135961082 isoform X1 [Calliphora vicina]|uniref:uncharacterized protein LOC135961082 isoform X1 n=1 Tax=Calliphora vicina TaxID=7373 RepID=UPI00325B42B6
MDTEEITLKAGDVCLDCQQQGLVKRLRYFKLNLNGDTLLKCESNECMYPYNDEMSSSDDEEEDIQNLTETNSLKFIDDFIQQYSNETEVQNSNYDLPTNANVSEQVTTTFDISFLDSLNESENLCKNEILDNKSNVEIIETQYLTLPSLNPLECEITPVVVEEQGNNLCKIEIPKESVDFTDNKTNVKIIENQYFTLPNLKSVECEIIPAVAKEQHDIQILTFIDETVNDCKPKIDIQSIETIKMESPLYNIFPSSSKSIATSREISSTTTSKLLAANLSNIPTKTSTIPLKNTTPLQITVTKNESPPKSIGSDIPKANIMKGSDFLKKLAIVEEKTAKENPKLKGSRSKKKIAKKIVMKNEEKPSLSFSGDSDYSLDMISKMLMANKMKTESKK